MALRKMLGKRLFDGRIVTSPPVTPEHSPITSSPSIQTVVPATVAKSNFNREYMASPDSADQGFFRRFLHRRAQHQSAAKLPEFLSLPVGEKLREKLRIPEITSNRLRLDFLSPPAPDPAAGDSLFGLSVSDARKILRLAQVEKLKSKLREIPTTWISYSEFFRICVEGCENEDQGAEFAKMMDESGNVIVLGNVVFLRPEQVAKSMESIISQSVATAKDPRRKELEQMEKQKAVIDQKAREQVRGELYCGLGFVLAQNLAAMRLTFWELSWDVMEPICFFVTSIHFALGFAFFIRTSTEPTFQGYFQRRFVAKQKRLMEINDFDVERYTQLRKAFCPTSSDLHHDHHQEGANFLHAVDHNRRKDFRTCFRNENYLHET